MVKLMWSSSQWVHYFRESRCSSLPIPWEHGVRLNAKEHALVAGSLPDFQQGEGQEGRHFFECVRTYARDSGDWEYAEAHRLFMEEEWGHSRLLGQFLDLAGIPRLTRSSLLNHGFCWCGSRLGLEWTLAVILMAEVMAQVYYSALYRLTTSTVLRRLCARILRDEKAHVRFQSERLALLRKGRRVWQLRLTLILDYFYFCGAVLACWWGHRQLLRAAGFPLFRFWNEAQRKLRFVLAMKDPRRCGRQRKTVARPDISVGYPLTGIAQG